MTTEHSRRNFLRGQFSQTEVSRMHPPGAQPDVAQLCTQCGACVDACPEAILIPQDASAPIVDFSRGACTFCNACAEACDTGALVPAEPPHWPWRATIAAHCFSLTGITCRACEDACAPRAIRFRLMTGGRAAPMLDSDLCTGCGACVSSCPAAAIRFEVPSDAEEELA
ncbi:ferredoxin-type protein NapF [Epibacterium sp. Ofav1-8]|uniref:ferredoxin-type protein NapF n=1 Tax=Epibacterium sp. Ofav1-8 TaxID=2917735 RepID=UPI001EF47191|nr:ferredoxin-type protein NapF [Epibacterium sp. Ofav1-8]